MSNHRASGPIVCLVLGGILALVGYLVAFHIGSAILKNAKASESWPTTQGVVKSSEVTTSRDSDRSTQYSAEILYTYKVESREYQANKVWFGGNYSSSSSGDHYETARRYPVGAEVTVHYDPQHPEVAVLQPGAFYSSYIVYLTGWALFVVGLCLLLSFFVSLLRRLLLGVG